MNKYLRHISIIYFCLISFQSIGQDYLITGSPDLSSPFTSVITHFENLQEENYNPGLAATVFMREGVTPQEAERLAVKLKQIIDGRVIYLNYLAIPKDPDYIDTLTQTQSYVLSSHLPEVYLVKVGVKWMYSEKTIANIDDLYKQTYPYGSDRLLDLLPKMGHKKFAGLHSWQWLGLLILTIIAIVVQYILSQLIRRLIHAVLHTTGKVEFKGKVLAVAKPISWILVFWWISLFIPALQLPITSGYRYIPLIVRAAIPVFSTVFGYKLTELIFTFYKPSPYVTRVTLRQQLLPLIKNVIQGIIIIVGVFITLYDLDVDIIPILTGLSIGGIAIALAAQDTLKNFFGSFMIFLDKPFQIGDWIVTDSIDGVVEIVGLRSTRIRTFKNSVVYVPNGHLADSTIDNMGLRVYRRYKTSISITYDTHPDMIELFVKGLKKIITHHPDTRKDNFIVDFTEMGEHSLNIMFYLFFRVASYGDEQHARHQINMKILRLGNELGIRFAFPTQTLHMETFPEKSSLTPATPQNLKELEKKMEEIVKVDEED